MTNIKIFQDINQQWIPARSYQIEAYQAFISNKELPTKYDKNGYTFTIERPKSNTLPQIKRPNGTTTPIADHDDVKIFSLNETGDWHASHPYYSWAYFHFMTKDTHTITYSTTSHSHTDETIIPSTIEPTKITTFSITRDKKTKVINIINSDNSQNRISDSEYERSTYLHFYYRLTYIEPIQPHTPNKKRKTYDNTSFTPKKLKSHSYYKTH